jgi:dienelactone hydrolase
MIVKIETFTPDNFSDIYRDEWKVKPAEIFGTLSLPEGDGPFPAVILYHGSGHPKRLGPWFKDLVPGLVGAGIAAFVLDSYTSRDISSSAADQTKLSKATRIVDAFQALKKLASLSMIDKNKIGISGYSFGGTVAMVSADTRLVEAGLAGGKKFAAHLPVYPSCQSQFRTLKLTGAPMLFLVGGLDDYTPAKYCVSYAERMVAEGYDAMIKVYPGAYHAWINDYGVNRCNRCVTFADCGQMYIEDDGHEAALNGKASTKDGWNQFIKTMFRTCGKRGVTLRVNKKARQDTLAATVKFFSTTLVLKK